MTDIRGPDEKDLAKEDYLNGMKYKDLAEKYDVSLNTIKSWVKRYNWADEKKQRGAPKRKKGAPLNNKNAVGHGPPKENKNAEKHGFFSKYLPEETMDIIQEIQDMNPLDFLWDSIQFQYAIIIRAQKIMHVTSKNEMIKELKKKKVELDVLNKSEDNPKAIETYVEEEWEFQFAWDRHATLLKAQSRAMGELRSLIKQYDELLNANRELATEEQVARIANIKANTSRITGENAEVEDLSEIYAEIYGDSNGN